MDINELFKKDKRESAVDIVVNNIKQLLIERKLKSKEIHGLVVSV